MSDEHIIFTKIDNAQGFRRAELESVKDTLHLLQGFEKLSQIRTEKAEKSILLAKQMKELQLLMNKTKGLFPVLPEHHAAPAAESAKAKKSTTGKTKAAKIKPLAKEEQHTLPAGLAALEKQLKDIEGKLHILS
ncbi:MAG: hypothetical protein Q7R76_06920 [Candidatus Woesearchaeota archaeon]|nr:hypothetical protein [Candidatus Woesearchaeota archaeon]